MVTVADLSHENAFMIFDLAGENAGGHMTKSRRRTKFFDREEEEKPSGFFDVIYQGTGASPGRKRDIPPRCVPIQRENQYTSSCEPISIKTI